jgi:hypothetical protein
VQERGAGGPQDGAAAWKAASELGGLGDGGACGGGVAGGQPGQGRAEGASVAGGQDAAEHGDRDRTADLPQRAVHRGSCPGFVAAYRGHDLVHRGRDGHAGAEPGQGEPGGRDGVARFQADLAEHGESRCQQRQPGGYGHPGAGRSRDQAGRAARDEQAAHHREQPQAGTDRVVAEDALQVLGQREHDSVQRDRDCDRGGRAPGKPPVAEYRQVDEPVRGALLAEEESGDQDSRSGQHPPAARRRPAVFRAVDDAPDQAGDRSGGQQRARDVQRRRGGVARFGHQRGAGGQGQADGGHVDPEHRVPREVLQQQAAEDRAERKPGRDDRGEDADGLGPFGVAERRRDDRDGQGEHDPRAKPHHRPRRDQLPRRLRQRAPYRRPEEHRQPGQQQPPAAKPVSGHPGGQHDPGERQGVSVHDPLQVPGAGVQRRRDRGQRDVQDRQVQGHDDHRQARDAQHPPSSCAHREPPLCYQLTCYRLTYWFRDGIAREPVRTAGVLELAITRARRRGAQRPTEPLTSPYRMGYILK